MSELIDFVNRLSAETIQKILSELYQDLPVLTVYNPEAAVRVSWLIDAIETTFA